MEIIPVADLLDSRVVHARRGDRANYRPIRSQLCPDSEPLAVIDGLLELYPFRQLYIADLNAIQGRSSHRSVIQAIRHRHPHLEIWLDAAIRDCETAQAWQELGVCCVIGSESLPDIETYTAISASLNRSFVLSLDFARGVFLGPAELLRQPDAWPSHVIAMNLDRVGSDSGPDLALLHSLKINAKALYAAGGVRDESDLLMLAGNGIAGALIASALHTGRIGKFEIDAIQGYPHRK
jgi:phosphoribosylformimino-5-aminoimidazole carboxamide ribotide isomerase